MKFRSSQVTYIILGKQSDGSLDIHRSVTVAPQGGFKHFQGPLSSCDLYGLMDFVPLVFSTSTCKCLEGFVPKSDDEWNQELLDILSVIKILGHDSCGCWRYKLKQNGETPNFKSEEERGRKGDKRERGMEGWREEGREGERERGMEGWREGGREGMREGGMEGWREGGREGMREGEEGGREGERN
ncbi:LOW QUALITY PROTEIN: hypothetical protein YC2023_112291 [Brassica napus]